MGSVSLSRLTMSMFAVAGGGAAGGVAVGIISVTGYSTSQSPRSSRGMRFFRKEPEKMSMLRQDPLTGRWVIMAAGRQERPNEFRLMQRDLAPGAHCPFCPGHEDS